MIRWQRPRDSIEWLGDREARRLCAETVVHNKE